MPNFKITSKYVMVNKKTKDHQNEVREYWPYFAKDKQEAIEWHEARCKRRDQIVGDIKTTAIELA